MRAPAALLLAAAMSPAANYLAEKTLQDGVEVVRLVDQARLTEVLIAPSFGNNAFSMKVNAQQVFWSPTASLRELMAKPTFAGNPFLAPWANRIDGESYWVAGKQYLLNPHLGNYRRDNFKQPIHGLLSYASQWEVTLVRASETEAVTVSRLEFWRYPQWLAQFPFPHTIEMIHRLREGVLEVETVLLNHGEDPLPVAIGYHPYFQLTDSERDAWQVHVAARDQVVLSPTLVPTGEVKPSALADPFPLRGAQLDNVFTTLQREPNGRAVFWVQGRHQKLAVEYGPNYPVAVIYAPPGRGFICFEPMAAPTNGFNLHHQGKFPLQTAPAGGEWRESFWIRPSGF